MNECPGSALFSFHSEQCSLIQLDLLVRGRSRQVCDVRAGGRDLVVLSCLRTTGFVFSERLCGTALAEACLITEPLPVHLRWDRERGWMGGVWASGQPELPGHLLRRPHLSEKHGAALWLTCCSGFSGGRLQLVASTCQTVKWVILMLVI